MSIFKKKKLIDEDKVEERKENINVANELAPFEFEPFVDNNSFVNGDLFEVRDPKIIEKIGLVSAGMEPLLHKVESAKNSKNIELNDGEQFYRVFFPSGSTLMHAKEGKNLYRGTTVNSKNKINGQALLEKVNVSSTVKPVNTRLITPNLILTATNMIVDSYYSDGIETELSNITEQISEVSNFQENEYKGKVLALIVQTKKLAKFQAEVIENENLRKSRLQEIANLKQTTIELLGQANFKINDLVSETMKDYKQYEKQTKTVEKWHVCQGNLLKVLYRLEDLEYSLNLGQESREECYALSEQYEQQVRNVSIYVKNWHLENCDDFKIDFDEHKRQRIGFTGLISKPLHFINDDLMYQNVKSNLFKMIDDQVKDAKNQHLTNTRDRYDEGIEMIIKSGKLYYLKK
ncbi:hypothetical protein [Ligilactobacillus pobuzihii]|uniref:Uncharacterized protein n=1 Tax=Ligilactobacillus pobuzihii TaxID=449659 RepID=A0A0R2LNT8_9LACO|nr:hypothetical protein [Ligilactobacillus pobuzihii]KRK09261.1 hypothetical protein FD11_GL001065 [Ligilactobacillus pobuzihii E100301 = KCTC 13174]KRO01152.1 hypothetical protein IV66_GL001120 [Ligilactobacillus pobuzihii]GEN49088.1 hypothetical protein LPO01_18800 [Ligilactobacillus pobuzihii]